MEWTHDKVLFFINLYRNKRVLWDAQNPQHYNNLRKNKAWQELADELSTTVDECKRKMTSLLASLRREKAKVAKSKRAGKGPDDMYISNWFAYKAMTFVLNRNNPGSTVDSIETDNEREEEKAILGQKKKDRIANTYTDDESRPLPSKKAKTSAICQTVSQISEIATRPAFDECESFGLFISSKLKNYNRSTRCTVQHHISNILFNADQGRYDSVSEEIDHYDNVPRDPLSSNYRTESPKSYTSTYSITHSP